MATPTPHDAAHSPVSLLHSLSSSLEAAAKAVTLDPAVDGVSLLDVKNELLLSYLQHLVFFVLLRLRRSIGFNEDGDTESDLDDLVSGKLVALRFYLEKGTRPLEEKMRYQLDRLLRTAREADVSIAGLRAAKRTRATSGEPDLGAESEDGGSDTDAVDGDLDQARHATDVTSNAARPQLSNMVVPVLRADDPDQPDGIYRPPRRERKLMEPVRRRDKAERRPQRSATMEEFVATELSTAPLAEPSIGTTIVAGGRRVKTTHERMVDAKRRDYEETNFIRLPKEGKKDRTSKARATERSGRMSFGGEDWTELGQRADRINTLTQHKAGANTGVKALLEKSRKRIRDVEDGRAPDPSREQIGDRFRKRVKLLERRRKK